MISGKDPQAGPPHNPFNYSFTRGVISRIKQTSPMMIHSYISLFKKQHAHRLERSRIPPLHPLMITFLSRCRLIESKCFPFGRMHLSSHRSRERQQRAQQALDVSIAVPCVLECLRLSLSFVHRSPTIVRINDCCIQFLLEGPRRSSSPQ